MDKVKLYEALKTIVECCKEHEECEFCPLHSRSERACGLQSQAPEYWTLIDPQDSPLTESLFE